MRRRNVFLAVACLALWHAGASGQDENRPPRFSVVKTPTGAVFTSKDRDNRFSFEVVAREIKPADPEKPIWGVDGQVLQVISVPPAAFGVEGAAVPEETLLRKHQKYDLDCFAGEGMRKVEGSDDLFSTPDGRKCLYWEMVCTPEREKVRKGNVKKNLLTSTVAGGNVVQLGYAITDGTDEARFRRSLKDTILSLKREGGNREANLPPGEIPDEAKTLSAAATTLELITGQKYTSLINADLISQGDAKMTQKVVLKPHNLIRLTRLLVQLNGGSYPTHVFDGKSAHAVNLQDFDRSKMCFLYSDPWVRDTFLARKNNKAGVNAVRHSDEVNDWEIKEKELERVIYGIVVPDDDLKGIDRLLATMRGDTDQAVLAYQKIKANNPDSLDVHVMRLNRAGYFFLDTQEYKTAVTVFTVNLQLNPTSAEAHAGLAEVLARQGRNDSAVDHYKQALGMLRSDPALHEDEKAALSKRVTEKLRELGR